MLAANSGRVTNLTRVTYIVMDEADRMFDLGKRQTYLLSELYCWLVSCVFLKQGRGVLVLTASMYSCS